MGACGHRKRAEELLALQTSLSRAAVDRSVVVEWSWRPGTSGAVGALRDVA